MKKNLINYTTMLCAILITQLHGQWQQSSGTENLDMQALLSHANYDFAGGATGTYRSSNNAESFNYSNTGNDANGPTRAFTVDNDYIYTGTSQGVFRSDNYGDSWQSKSNGLVSQLTHGVLNIDSRLIHVSPIGVSISNNQGENWMSAGLSGYDVRCVTHIDDTLFVGTNGDGLFKSMDWGNNWIPINNGSNSSNFRAIQSKGNILFAGGQNGTGVFKSINYGASWELLTNGIASSSFRGFASNDDLIVAGSTGSGVFYSLDDGISWVAINDNLPDLNVFDLEINNNYILAATHSSGVFRFELSNIISNMQGDMNDDEVINILDIILVVNMILGLSEYNELADLNNDDEVNILDIVSLVNIILDA